MPARPLTVPGAQEAQSRPPLLPALQEGMKEEASQEEEVFPEEDLAQEAAPGAQAGQPCRQDWKAKTWERSR